jgi:hypothetical protein
MQLRTKKQVESFMIKTFSEITEKIAKDLRRDLIEYIDSKTYEQDYFPNFKYEDGDGTFGSGQPSFEFEQSFRWKPTKVSPREISKQLYYAWENMTVDRYTGRHWEDERDTRKDLADMLNVDGIVGHKKRLPYWDIFIRQMDLEFDRIFRKEVANRGIKMVHSGTFSDNYREQIEGMGKAIDNFLYDSFASLI